MRSRAVTLDEVARTSGVSRATASRALNGRERVNPDVRVRVQMVADSLGYRPNTAARSLASGRSGVLGMVLPTGHLISQPYEAHLLEAIAEAASTSGQGVMLWLAANEPGPALRRVFRAGLVDGIVVSGMAIGSPWVEDLFDGPHPCVLVGRHPSRDDIPRVELANRQGAARAVEHLVAGGGERIAIVLGPPDRVDGRDRYAGYKDALEANGLTVDKRLVEVGEFNMESGYDAMRRLLAHRPDSVFACNDPMAAGVVRAVREAGLRIPDDVAVMGFDDLPIASITDPPLSTVGQDLDAIGTAAVALLLELVGGDAAGVARQTLIDAPLVVRGSTRPVVGDSSVAARDGERDDTTSRTPVASSTSQQENRRATS